MMQELADSYGRISIAETLKISNKYLLSLSFFKQKGKDVAKTMEH